MQRAVRFSRRFSVLLVAASAAVYICVFATGLPGTRIDFFDIGQGDAVLISDGWNQMLIDGGPDRSVLAKLGKVMPFLDRTLEVVVLTHPHDDHVSGLVDVLKRYDVRTVVIAGSSADSLVYGAFMDAVRASGADIVTARQGDTLKLGDRIAFDVLWPKDGFRSDDLNDESVVLRMRSEIHSLRAIAVLTGDATALVEEGIVAHGEDLDSVILKVGHHGSPTSSTNGFLRVVGGENAVISVGKKNWFGHPARTVLARLRARGYGIWRTDGLGDIRADITREGVILRTCRPFCVW